MELCVEVFFDWKEGAFCGMHEYLPVIYLIGTELSRESYSSLDGIDHRQHGKSSYGMLGEPLIAHFGKPRSD